MSCRLYVTDLDGTLLNGQGELSKFSVLHLNKLIDLGVNITVASARNLKSIRNILNNVTFQIPVISLNGGFISDIKKQKHLKIQAIDHKLAEGIYELLPEGVLISTHHRGLEKLYYDKKKTPGMEQYVLDREKALNEKVLRCQHFFDLKEKDIMAFTIITNKVKALEIQNLLKLKFGDTVIIEAWEDMYYKPWYWVSVHSQEATKAKGLNELIKILSEPINEIIVFGDQMNDLEMFKYADSAYAVDNAIEIIKAHATGVIGHHQNDGVVKKILELEGYPYDLV